jgi:phage tail sheath protein FI
MARTSYSAPGVYVEEVPSAQQPIAGVGTNTVGFVGVVDDVIMIPVVPPEEEESEAVRDAEERATRTQQALDNLSDRQREKKQELDKAKDPQKPALGEQLKEIDEKVGQATQDRDRAKRELEELRRKVPRETEKSKPYYPYYMLKPFTVEPEPYDTKFCTNFGEYTRRFGPFSADDPDKKPGQALHPGHRALTHAVFGFFKNGGTKCFVTRVRNEREIEKALAAFESIDAIAIVAAPGMHGKPIWQMLRAHCDTCEDRFAIFDGPEDVETTDKQLDINQFEIGGTEGPMPGPYKNAAYYYPYIEVIDSAKQLQDEDPARGVRTKDRGKICVAPSGHIAGIYARTDEERGVHKAPANTTVVGALDVKYYIGKPKQELLNPKGVNCIRSMNGNITVWGARTIGGDKNGEWKYVSVRRLFLYLAESIDEGTQWVVFEPNDQALWGKIRRNVGAFLNNVWRSGALFGATPQEAFYVKCDEETNPPEVRELGQVITEVGVSIVRPAEFVIFRIQQSAGREA